MNQDSDPDGTPGSNKGAVDWAAFLRGDGEDGAAPWIRLSPERVAVMALADCATQLGRAAGDVDWLALAAKSIHMALQAALTAALAGTANIGAHPSVLRAAHLAHLEGRGSGPPRPTADKVMGFVELLDVATSQPLPWTGAPLVIDDRDQELIARLTTIRHAVEHPKQIVHSIEPRYVAETLPIAAVLVSDLLATVFHHLGPGGLEHLNALVATVQDRSEVFMRAPG